MTDVVAQAGARPARETCPARVTRPARVLLTGWFSFLHGEVTAGDMLAAEAVRDTLRAASIPHETAWSPVFRPGALCLEDADPEQYTHVVFTCGPLHSHPAPDGGPSPLLGLHDRFARCRRIAVGVSVPDPADPAVTRFDDLLPRDTAGRAQPAGDLSVHAPLPAPVPVLGVIQTQGQHEYGSRRRHGEVARSLDRWLGTLEAARLPLDTRLDSRDWRLPATPGQLHSVLSRLDAVVTTRLHGLVLALRAGVPALAVDPVAGGAKVRAQATALGWPAVLPYEAVRPASLDRLLAWCLSPEGRQRAADAAARTDGVRPPGEDGLLPGLLRRLGH
ncbi:polysaccharide pyruvyl transferase family protein [Streptomyces sp. MST-110588]|uniref:polysaccharide pyruvyl transferase family protein n=1 Tax=Streptomyces sp. MST-110588 TaxID=2833628 RepID=UPI001F5D0ED8|nr:polysaccharide pyruvyl transferase family protein [Streptomyces sp. MST-110588]UNO39837.1 polysaccharide pyruvyl transferase family protein [Streptomyces sp. MST-110588]